MGRRRFFLGELFAVLSGKGGTGKTSVCAGIATALAAEGKRVLCIDCDVGLRNLDISLGLADSGALSFRDVCEGAYTLDQAEKHPDYPSLSFLTAPMNCHIEQIDPAGFGDMLQRAREQFDYVFLDAPAGVDAGFKLAASCAERCVIVTGPGPAAIRDACRVADLLELMGKTNSRLVVNRVSHRLVAALNTNVDDVMDEAPSDSTKTPHSQINKYQMASCFLAAVAEVSRTLTLSFSYIHTVATLILP